MPRFDKFESRFGRFAIPGLIQVIAGFQLLTLLLTMLLQREGQVPFTDFLLLDPARVMSGEVWRLATYVFIPSRDFFFAVIGALFMMWLGRGLDEAWGAFRVNLYVMGGIAAVAVGAMIFGYQVNATFFYLTTLFAFACIYPNEEILLMFILPVKMKWIAWLAAGGVVLMVLREPLGFIPVAFALVNFGVAFGPGFFKGRLQMAQTAKRRERFEGTGPDAAVSFHQCTKCGKTEKDDPALEFRVNADGDEICSACRK